MHIIPYISQYLHLHKKVAITGLGEFYLKRVNGFLDEYSHTLYPPSVKVKFKDREVVDSDFAQNISNQTQIDLDKVIYHIEKLVRDIKKKVESENAYLLENIGSLELNRGLIKLVNSDTTTYNQDFYGFKSQPYKPITEVYFINPTLQQETKEVPVESEQLEQDFPLSYSLAEQALNSASSSEIENSLTRKSSWLWILITVLIIVTILGAIVYYFYSLKPTEVIKTPVKKVVTVVQKTAESQKPDSVLYHEVIIAENLLDDNADKLINKLKLKGIDAHLVIDSLSSYIQISAAQFTNLDSAEAKLKIIKQNYYPKAYLKTIKSIN